MHKRIVCTAMVTVLTVMGTAGCFTSSRGKDERSAGRVRDDKDLAEKIEKSLGQEPVYKFGNVNVMTYAGEVQLSGFVNSEQQRDRAGAIAAETPGVLKVHNTLVLKPYATPTGRPNQAPGNKIYSSPTPEQSMQEQPTPPQTPPPPQPPPQEQGNEPK